MNTILSGWFTNFNYLMQMRVCDNGAIVIRLFSSSRILFGRMFFGWASWIGISCVIDTFRNPNQSKIFRIKSINRKYSQLIPANSAVRIIVKVNEYRIKEKCQWRWRKTITVGVSFQMKANRKHKDRHSRPFYLIRRWNGIECQRYLHFCCLWSSVF